MTRTATFPKALKHGNIKELFKNIFLVTGSVALKAPSLKFGPMKMVFSRNMVIIKQGDELTLINSVRLNDAGLNELDRLGTVKHIVRLAAFHGMDDPFYKDRYQAQVWSVNAPYTPGFKIGASEEEAYFKPDTVLSTDTQLPIDQARYIEFKSCTPNESVLLLQRDNGILIAGDSLQNWGKPDEFFNLTARFIMQKAGFIKPYNIGPGWLKFTKPDLNEIKAALDVPYECLLPAHGEPIMQGAKAKYDATLDSLLSEQLESATQTA